MSIELAQDEWNPVKLSVLVHPDLRKALKRTAVDEDVTITEKMHVMLCHALNRPDLLSQTAAPQLASTH